MNQSVKRLLGAILLIATVGASAVLAVRTNAMQSTASAQISSISINLTDNISTHG